MGETHINWYNNVTDELVHDWYMVPNCGAVDPRARKMGIVVTSVNG